MTRPEERPEGAGSSPRAGEKEISARTGKRWYHSGRTVGAPAEPSAPHTPRRPDRYSSQSKNNYFAEMWISSEEGSYLRLIDLCITQL